MTAKDDGSERDKRLKAALRDNLKRRKQAARRSREDERENREESPDKTSP